MSCQCIECMYEQGYYTVALCGGKPCLQWMVLGENSGRCGIYHRNVLTAMLGINKEVRNELICTLAGQLPLKVHTVKYCSFLNSLN